MKFKIAPDAFLKSLNLSGIVVSSRSPTPGGRSVVLSAKGDGLWQYAAQGAMAIEHRVDAQVLEEGECAVDFELLKADIASISSELTVRSTKSNLLLNAGRAKRRKRLVSLDEFPLKPSVTGETFGVSGSKLVDAVNQVTFSIIRDGSRPELRCVRLGNGQLMGGDGLRFSSVTTEFPVDVSIPFDMLDALKTVAAQADTLTCTVGANGWIRFKHGDCALSFSLLNYDYPVGAMQVLEHYRDKPPTIELEVVRTKMILLLDALSIYAGRGKRYGIEYVKFDMSEGYPRVTADVPDMGTFEDEIPTVKVEGDIAPILFSPSLLLEVFNCGSMETLIWKMYSPTDAMVITEPENSDWIALQSVMASRETVNDEDDF